MAGVKTTFPGSLKKSRIAWRTKLTCQAFKAPGVWRNEYEPHMNESSSPSRNLSSSIRQCGRGSERASKPEPTRESPSPLSSLLPPLFSLNPRNAFAHRSAFQISQVGSFFCVALDAHITGDKSRFVRNPSVILCPTMFCLSKEAGELEDRHDEDAIKISLRRGI